MTDELQASLRRLGVVKGARHLKSATARRPSTDEADAARSSPPAALPAAADDAAMDDAPVALATLLPGGRLVETAAGACFVVDRVFPLAHRHGPHRLGDLRAASVGNLARMMPAARLAGMKFDDFLFLDTETTGLAGAGTLAFMVGVAYFDQDALVVRQFFLRDHADEAGMLTLLDALLAQRPGLISFNGRSFDLPLLETRYLMNRRDTDLLARPHLDLLPPARRLWRLRLGSCALGALEQTLLGVTRTQEDVPGWLIPSLYHDYLRSGDARELQRVFYHNQIDMLSMVTLAWQITAVLDGVTEANPVDLVSLGRWQVDAGLLPEAEASLRRATAADLPLAHYHQALFRLAALLKRQARREEAVPLWQQVAATSLDTVDAHVELAMHYEWQAQDLEAAATWTERALALTQHWPRGRAALVRPALRHRLARLRRKTAREA